MTFTDNCNQILEQLAKGMSLDDIAKETGTNVKEIKTELKKGIKTEKEHTTSTNKAKKIAKDHLVEKPKYYTKLKQAGL